METDASDAPILVRINTPTPDIANAIARRAVDTRLAACANVEPPIRSVYRWQGQIEEAEETPLLLKTTRARFAAIAALLAELHPDDIPAILALPVAETTEAFGAWLAAETAPRA